VKGLPAGGGHRRQMCKTNPIGPARSEVGEDWRGRRARPEGKYAKQTQFPAGSGGPRSRARGAIMQNEPNLRIESCETNPNVGDMEYIGKGRRVWRWPARGEIRKYAKQTQFRSPEQNVGRGRPTYEECKTKPIYPARPGMGAGWLAATLRRSAMVQNEANSRSKTASMDRAVATECRPHSTD
jgi:hypothetical protein